MNADINHTICAERFLVANGLVSEHLGQAVFIVLAESASLMSQKDLSLPGPSAPFCKEIRSCTSDNSSYSLWVATVCQEKMDGFFVLALKGKFLPKFKLTYTTRSTKTKQYTLIYTSP